MADISPEAMSLEQSPCPLVQCDAWEGSLANVEAALADETGGPLPSRVGEIVSRNGLRIVRAAPRRFWIFPQERGSSIGSGIPAEFGCRLDLGEGRVRLRITSVDLRGVLSRCLAVDWELTLGTATFSSLHHIPVMFTRSSNTEGEFVVPRSFARSISEWLKECA